MNGGRFYFMRVTHDSITIYTIIIVHSGFLLVESRAQLLNRRTADAISVTSQSRLFANFEQPIAFLVLYRSCQIARENLLAALQNFACLAKFSTFYYT